MTDAEPDKPAPKRGRPAGKRGTFSFRVTASLRSKLEAAAEASARPVSEEIEHRLERSFEDVDLLLRHFGSSESLKLAQAVSMLGQHVETQTMRKWTEDPKAKGEYLAGIKRFLDIYFYEQDGPDVVPVVLPPLAGPSPGRSAAEVVAIGLGLRSVVRTRMEEFLASEEGLALMAKAGQPDQK